MGVALISKRASRGVILGVAGSRCARAGSVRSTLDPKKYPNSGNIAMVRWQVD